MHMRIISIVAVAFLLCGPLMIVPCKAEEKISFTDAEIAEKLSELNPLPKVHYSWKIEAGSLLDPPNNRLLYEYARITHALSLCGESVTADQLTRCLKVCKQINQSNPQLPCSLAINFSPWHRKFDPDLPPTDRGSSYDEEIRYFLLRVNYIKQVVEDFNKDSQQKVNVSALLLDSERFYIRPNDPKWNNAIQELLDSIHRKAAVVFPDSRIEWYGRGIHRVPRGSGWEKTPIWTGKEITPALSCSLYTIPEIEKTRETFRRTCKLADEMNIKEVTPWIALASGYRPVLTKKPSMDLDWDYDLIYSYQIGAELNVNWYARQSSEWYAPYDHAKVVVFYPAPFNRKSPAWGKHFVAYVRGAIQAKNLKDLGFDR